MLCSSHRRYSSPAAGSRLRNRHVASSSPAHMSTCWLERRERYRGLPLMKDCSAQILPVVLSRGLRCAGNFHVSRPPVVGVAREPAIARAENGTLRSGETVSTRHSCRLHRLHPVPRSVAALICRPSVTSEGRAYQYSLQSRTSASQGQVLTNRSDQQIPDAWLATALTAEVTAIPKFHTLGHLAQQAGQHHTAPCGLTQLTRSGQNQ